MPTYQYRCTDCGEPLEVVQSFTDDALTVCPACGGSLRKVFNSVGIVFKGSGFYRTDSRAEANGSAKKSETKTETAPVKSESTSSESKSGAKSDKSASPSSASSGSESSTTKSSAA